MYLDIKCVGEHKALYRGAVARSRSARTTGLPLAPPATQRRLEHHESVADSESVRISNRHYPVLLETIVSHSKQTTEYRSNRHFWPTFYSKSHDSVKSISVGRRVNPLVLYAPYATPTASQISPAYFVQVCRLNSSTAQNTIPNTGTNASLNKFLFPTASAENQNVAAPPGSLP